MASPRASTDPPWVHEEPPEPAVRYREERPTTWSPPVPVFRDEPWRDQPRMTPEATESYLVELRKAAESRLEGLRPRITPEQTATYLAACTAKGYSTVPLEALGPLPDPKPSNPNAGPHMRKYPKGWMARLYPVTEAEERAARRGV